MSVTAAEFLAVWGFLGLNILTPGPNVINTLTTAMGSGRGPGLAAALGVGVGISLWCFGMALGMAALFALLPGARTALGALGVALLVWFALRYLRAAARGRRGTEMRGVSGIAPRAAFLRSLAVNVTNPKALTTWLVILTLFPVSRAGLAEVALLGAGAAAMAGGIHAAYALAFSTPPAARFYLRAGPAINAGVGLFFLAIAVRLGLPLLP